MSLEAVLEEMARSGAPGRLLVWHEGMTQWTQAHLVPEIAARMSLPAAALPAPAAAVERQRPEPPELSFAIKQPQWFMVGLPKLVVMTLVTLGLYQLYWFYRQWVRVRDAGDSVAPLPRAIFGIIYCHSLFDRIIDSASVAGVETHIPAGALSITFILFSLTWRLPSPLEWLGFLSMVPLVLAQRVATAVVLRQGSAEDRNTRLTLLNWAGVAVGGLVFLLAVLGTMLGKRPSAGQPPPQASLSAAAAEVNKTLPKMLDKETEFVDTVGQEGALVYHYRLVNYSAEQLNPAKLEAGLRPGLVQKACTTPATRSLLARAVKLHHVYGDKDGRAVLTIEIVAKDCGL